MGVGLPARKGKELCATAFLKPQAAPPPLSLAPIPSSPSSPSGLSSPSRLPLVMAAFNKLGSLLRHNALTSGSSAISSPAVFNAARLMSTKLFVGGLSWGTDDQSLKEAFSGFGEVTEARVITDRETGRSRGFGFVSFNSDEDAKAAITAMDGQELDGRSVRVNVANERPAGPRTGGGYGGGGGYSGGGGYGGGGYGGGGGGGRYGGGNQSYGGQDSF
ncbi:hypothetical protein EJB05_17963, partial [Eragrostis curvula]